MVHEIDIFLIAFLQDETEFKLTHGNGTISITKYFQFLNGHFFLTFSKTFYTLIAQKPQNRYSSSILLKYDVITTKMPILMELINTEMNFLKN